MRCSKRGVEHAGPQFTNTVDETYTKVERQIMLAYGKFFSKIITIQREDKEQKQYSLQFLHMNGFEINKWITAYNRGFTAKVSIQISKKFLPQ